MKRKAFTLLETVIALAIAMIVMGATVTANRVVQRNSQISELRAQQESILQDTFDLLTLTHNNLRQQSAAFSTAFSGIGVNSPLRIAPYRFRPGAALAATDTSIIQWCTAATAGGCMSTVSYASPTATSYSMTDALGATGAEVIAVRRTAPVAGQHQVHDFSNPPLASAVVSSSIAATNAAHQTDWDFYRRQITITQRSAVQYGGYLVTVTVWPMLAGANRQADGVTRTMVFTDYTL